MFDEICRGMEAARVRIFVVCTENMFSADVSDRLMCTEEFVSSNVCVYLWREPFLITSWEQTSLLPLSAGVDHEES